MSGGEATGSVGGVVDAGDAGVAGEAIDAGDVGMDASDTVAGTAAGPSTTAEWHAHLHTALQDLADRPNDRHAELRRVQATLALGQPGAALAILRRYLHGVPDDARALDLLAAAQLLLGRPRPALVAADLAVAADPTYTIARYNRACARARLGDVEGALADLAVLAEVMPGVVAAAATDPDLAAVRSDPRLAALVGAAAAGVTAPG